LRPAVSIAPLSRYQRPVRFMLHCKISNRKAADKVRDNLSRSWDYVLVPVTLRSLLTANNWRPLIFKACHTLATKRARDDGV